MHYYEICKNYIGYICSEMMILNLKFNKTVLNLSTRTLNYLNSKYTVIVRISVRNYNSYYFKLLLEGIKKKKKYI